MDESWCRRRININQQGIATSTSQQLLTHSTETKKNSDQHENRDLLTLFREFVVSLPPLSISGHEIDAMLAEMLENWKNIAGNKKKTHGAQKSRSASQLELRVKGSSRNSK
jgi:hypothetical protein